MRSNSLNKVISGHLGNHRGRRYELQALSFPGLSIDNISTTPGAGGSGDVLGGLVARASGGSQNGVGQQVSELSKQLNDLKTVQQTQLDTITQNTAALAQNTASRSAGTSGGTSTTGILSSLLGATGLSPIFSGLLGLFGGSKAAPLAPLTGFSLPPSIQYAAGVSQTGGGVQPLDYGQNGQLRPVGGQGGGSNAAQQPQTVQIQVNAMNSQSFLDHSDDIARAVRQALLQSNSLSDVITDL